MASGGREQVERLCIVVAGWQLPLAATVQRRTPPLARNMIEITLSTLARSRGKILVPAPVRAGPWGFELLRPASLSSPATPRSTQGLFQRGLPGFLLKEAAGLTTPTMFEPLNTMQVVTTTSPPPNANLCASLKDSTSPVSNMAASAVSVSYFFIDYIITWDRTDCGNTVFGNNRPASASLCSMACSGDSSQQCGGPDAIFVYVKDAYPFTVGPASAVESYNGYEKTQCW
ncbi:15486_t:CDS:2, partial [Acaulospora colombiana]